MNEGSASSSSSFRYGLDYDVFLSSNSRDRCNDLARSLYCTLSERGFRTFLGDGAIMPDAAQAIGQSRNAIVVFSENYASSPICLNLLVQILYRFRGNGGFVWAVFYHVDRSDGWQACESTLGFLRYLNIEGCDFLAELPDFSGASNLEEVSVAHCKNLMKVYNTSGYHANLRALRARGCTKLVSFLEDGINLPSLEVLDLTGCSSLAQVSGSSLLSQILQVPGNRKFILPGGQVPEWIHCFNSGSSVSLRVRNKFPEIAVCVVFDVKGRGSTFFEFGIRVLINGTHSFVVKTDVLDIESGHVYLFDVQRQEFELKRELLGNKFNDVRISCNAHNINGSSDAYSYVKYIGVYVYNFGSCADDIQFESPRRTLDIGRPTFYPVGLAAPLDFQKIRVLNPPLTPEDMICDEDCNCSVYSDGSEEDRLYYEDLEVTTEAPQKSCNGKMLGFLRYLNIEGCDFLAELPDFSGASNLEEVSVAHCKNLMKVYNTSGYHANLRALRARGCTKLVSFLEDGINFPSLEVLDLTGCSNFQKFPDILGKMENIKTLALSGTVIETLPESIENLTGLECLYLYNCQKLCQIPVDSICRLTNLVRLEAGSCRIFNWFKDHKVPGTVNLVLWNISRLHLNENNISDQLLAVILRLFPRLQVLELRDNDITVLPACIEECHSLKRLYLDGCKQLQEIRGIPQNIKILQVPRNRKFILPGGRVPEWIHCFNSGSSVSLRVRNKFPEIAVCVVFDVKGRGSTFFEFGIRVLINGTHSSVVKTDILDIESGHVYLFDVQRQEFELKRELLGNKFNDVRISCNAHHINGSSDAYSYVKYIGVYVYNFGSCVDDIQFESPRRTLEDMICDEDCNFSVYSDSSREDRLYYKDLQANEASENSCNGEMGSKQMGSTWHIWLCVAASSVLLCRFALHLLWLIHQSLGRFLSFVGYMEAGAMKP